MPPPPTDSRTSPPGIPLPKPETTLISPPDSQITPPPPVSDVTPPPPPVSDVAPPLGIPMASSLQKELILPPPTDIPSIAPPPSVTSTQDMQITPPCPPPLLSPGSTEPQIPPPSASTSQTPVPQPLSDIISPPIQAPAVNTITPPTDSLPPPPSEGTILPPPPASGDAPQIPPPPPTSTTPDWMSSLSDEEREKLPQMLKKRKNVADEILSTELTYVTNLNTIVDKFLEPLRADSLGCSKDEIYNIFSNIQVIRNCHDRFKDVLGPAVGSWNDNSGLGGAFQATAWIKFYKYYVNNYDICMSTLRQCLESHPPFKKFIDGLNYTAALNGLDLSGLLIAPVQRIPRYVLLLNDMLRSTPVSHPDHRLLAEALSSIKELADYINEHKHHSDNISELTELQAKFADYPGQLAQNPKRKLIKSGPISVNKEKAHMWLFNDIAILTRPEMKKGLFKYKQTVHLKTSSLQPDEGNKFKIVSMDGVLKCQVATLPEKEAWEKALNEAVAQAKELMIKSLFQDEMIADSECSKKFLEFKEAENEKKRAALVQTMLEREQEYVKFLTHTWNTFLLPVKKSIDSPSPMVRQTTAEVLLSNFELLVTIHKQIELDISQRIKDWEQNPTVSDLLALNTSLLPAYTQYVNQYGAQIRAITSALQSQVFSFWIRDVEVREKADVKNLMERPLRRLSEYYLLTQEMLEYTSRKHADYDPLSKLVNHLRELTDEHAKVIGSLSLGDSLAPPAGALQAMQKGASAATLRRKQSSMALTKTTPGKH
ncbi:guanine nucleotide exchange factor [Pelomyxa schiedti]|nr:guanine nucleotide exchange factor [Pelomyxa schiedti]